MQENFLKQLVNFGLSEKEARIYLSLLELEVSTVFEIAKHAEINRSSTYVVLEALIKKGFVSISNEKKVQRYIAVSPDTLLHSARIAAKRQDEVTLGVESIIPELKALHKATKTRPIVKIFEGENAAKEVYFDLFSTNNTKELRTFANPFLIFERVPDFQNQDKERGKRGIKMFAINPASKEVIELYKRVKPSQPAEALMIPEEKFNFSSDIGIYGNKVAFVSSKENFGIIIENKEIAEILKNSFDLAWEEAKRLSKQIKN